MHAIALTLIGLAVGCFGTLIGAGGGFLLAPILVLLYPDDRPETLTSISLIAVFFNAASGSLGYYKQRLIDVRAGLTFSLAATPGAIIGALVTTRLPRTTFEIALAIMLLVGSAFLLFRLPPEHSRHQPDTTDGLGPRIDRPRPLGEVIAFAVGFVSSLLGIGGGIIHVPAMVHLLNFPVHVAAATSHFVLALTAAVAIGTHAFSGSFEDALPRALPIALGAVIGAQLGARLSTRAAPALILRALSLALALAGLRILWTGAHELAHRANAAPAHTSPAPDP